MCMSSIFNQRITTRFVVIRQASGSVASVEYATAKDALEQCRQLGLGHRVIKVNKLMKG